jgi:hypothetical protein
MHPPAPRCGRRCRRARPRPWRVCRPALRGKTVYFEVASAPYAAGEASFIGENLARLGMGNIVPAALGPFPKLNPEFVVRAQPDLIMATASAVAEMPGAPRLGQRLRALRDGRHCGFAPERWDVLVRPGPRLAEAAEILADCLVHTRRPVPPLQPERHHECCAGHPCPCRICTPGLDARFAGRGAAGAGRPADPAGPGAGSEGWSLAWAEEWDLIGHPRAAHAGRAAGRRAAGPGRRAGAGPVPQPAGRPLPAGLCRRCRPGRGAGAGRRRPAGRPHRPGHADLLLRLGLVGAAFVGALGGVSLTLLLARGTGRPTVLLLSGVVVGVLLSALADGC